MESCADNLKKWNKFSLCSVQMDLRNRSKCLEDLQCLQPSRENLAVLLATEKKKNYLLENEEHRWRQRSRVNWLNYKDRNARFFHHFAELVNNETQSKLPLMLVVNGLK